MQIKIEFSPVKNYELNCFSIKQKELDYQWYHWKNTSLKCEILILLQYYECYIGKTSCQKSNFD